MTLGVFLQRPDGTTLLEKLEAESIAFVHTPRMAAGVKPDVYRAHDGSANSIDQGWGVLVPPGAGEDMLAAIDELIEWRRDSMCAAHAARGGKNVCPDVRYWPVSADMGAREFINLEYRPSPEHYRPRYLLILGDFDGISLEFQRQLAAFAFVGRLCFRRLEDYASYAKKVVASERLTAAVTRPRLLMMSTSTAKRRDYAVDEGHRHLIQGLAREFADPEFGFDDRFCIVGPRGHEPAARAWDGVKVELAAPQPTVFFSLGHGAGDPSWTAKEQRARQGDLIVDGRQTGVEDVGRGAFVPGGVWFNYACFSGGTPRTSAFEPWLRRLAEVGLLSPSVQVVDTLARERPFVACQAQAALANPAGPLAVIAHADIAFSYSFLRNAAQESRGYRGLRRRSTPEPLRDVIATLMSGGRVGLALSKLQAAIHDADQALLGHWQAREASSLALTSLLRSDSSRPETVQIRELLRRLGPRGLRLADIGRLSQRSPEELLADLREAIDQSALHHIGHNWMARHDLRGWIVLGDPAARLSGDW